MNKGTYRRCNDTPFPTPSRKMGVRNAPPNAEEEGSLTQDDAPPSYKGSESKLLFLAEHGYVLAGGTLCFLMGIMVSLVIVWIIILICNRQIAVERIGTQTKVAGVYADSIVRTQAITRPHLDLAKTFNCTSHTLIASTDYRITNLQTAMALAYEAGMKFIQDIVNRTIYSGLFTTIFTAAIIMLLIEIFCIVIFIAYKNNWRGFRDPKPGGGGGDQYSFFIQGPKVLHYGVFEVTNSLSNASMQVKSLLSRASRSCCPAPNDACCEPTTEITISLGGLPRLSEEAEDDDALLQASTVPNHPLSWHPYRSDLPQRTGDGGASGIDYCSNTVATETTPTLTDLESGSVGLQTLREHLEKRRLLVPDFPDLDTNGSLPLPESDTPKQPAEERDLDQVDEPKLSFEWQRSPSENSGANRRSSLNVSPDLVHWQSLKMPLDIRKQSVRQPAAETKSSSKNTSLEQRQSGRPRAGPATIVIFAENLPSLRPSNETPEWSVDLASVHTPRMSSPVWADSEAAPVIDKTHEDSQSDLSANSETLAELVDKEIGRT